MQLGYFINLTCSKRVKTPCPLYREFNQVSVKVKYENRFSSELSDGFDR